MIVLRPGATPLADWAAIFRGAAVRLPDDCLDGVRASAAAVDRIVASGQAVYGINTGFGKLASVRCSGTSSCRMRPASASPYPCRLRGC